MKKWISSIAVFVILVSPFVFGFWLNLTNVTRYYLADKYCRYEASGAYPFPHQDKLTSFLWRVSYRRCVYEKFSLDLYVHDEAFPKASGD